MRFRLVEYLLQESKQDIQRFIDKYGQERYDRFQSIKNRIPPNQEWEDPDTGACFVNPKDIVSLVKYGNDNMIDNMLDYFSGERNKDIESKGIPKPTNTKKLVLDDNGNKIWKVFDVGDMIDISSKKYGKEIGNWCIAGRYRTGGKLKVSQAKQYFNNYLDRTDGGYYVLITKDGSKYCILVRKDGSIHSFWDAEDNDIFNIVKVIKTFDDSVYNFFNIGIPIDWSKQIYYWNGEEEVPEKVVNVIIKDGVTKIGKGAFQGRLTLKSVTIPDSVTYILDSAFATCVSLQSISIKSGIVKIGKDAFFNCKLLQSVSIEEGVTEIGKFAFALCESLTEITIPNSVTEIGTGAFEHCDALKSIKMPSRFSYDLPFIGIDKNQTKVEFY